MKSGFWKIQLHEKDKYKTAFSVPFGHYEWNVMLFGLKNATSKFQNIMNDIFNPYSNFSIVYIDDVLIFSNFIEHHFKYLNILLKIVKENDLLEFSKNHKYENYFIIFNRLIQNKIFILEFSNIILFYFLSYFQNLSFNNYF